MAGIMTGVGRYAGSSMAILVLGLAVFVYSTFGFPPRPQSWRLASSIENGGIYPDLPLKERKPVINRAAEAQKFLFDVAAEGVYTVLVGPQGCGKTRLLLEIVRNQSGIVYVEYEPGRLFDNLRRAFDLRLPSEMLPIGFSYIPLLRHHLSYINWELGNDVDDALRLLMDVILPQASSYDAKAGRPFVLIIDDINKMLNRVEKGENALHKLQAALKKIADKLYMHVVLVDSAGEVVSHLRQKSAASRMQVIEVGDVDRENSIYLLSYRISKTNTSLSASDVYEVITGGRLLLIWTAVKCIEREHVSTIQAVMDCVSEEIPVRPNLKICGLAYYNESSLSWMVVRDLLEGDELIDTLDTKYTMSSSSFEFDLIFRCLVQNDIIYQHRNHSVTLYSNLVRTILRKRISDSKLHLGIVEEINQDKLEHKVGSEEAKESKETEEVKLEKEKSEL